jgi:hypothetical protein
VIILAKITALVLRSLLTLGPLSILYYQGLADNIFVNRMLIIELSDERTVEKRSHIVSIAEPPII